MKKYFTQCFNRMDSIAFGWIEGNRLNIAKVKRANKVLNKVGKNTFNL